MVKVEDYQTTFVIFEIEGYRLRFNVYDKQEFKLKKGTTGEFIYFEKHPLLLDYNESFTTTYINSKPDDIIKLSADIQEGINNITLGWRNWMDYITDRQSNFTIDTFERNLSEGIGKLLEAPESITKKVIEICDNHNVLTKTFIGRLKDAKYKLIMVGNNYIIAEKFVLLT